MAHPPAEKLSQWLTVGVASVAHAYSHLFILLYATVVLVLSDDLGMSYAELQWLSVPGFLLYGAAALPAGILGDRWSSSGMMAVFFLGIGGAAILTGFASSPAGLLIGLSLIGLFSSIYHPVGIAWLVKHSVNRGRALGVNGVFGNIGTAGAAIIAGVLADVLGWRFAFFVPGAIALATGFAFIYLQRRGLIVEGVADAKIIPAAPAQDVRRVFLAMTVTVICVGLIFQSTSVAMPKIFSDRLAFAGDGAMGAGVLVALVYLLAAGSQIIGGELADRYPLRRVYLIAQIAQIPIIFLAFITFNMGLVALAVLMVALNVGGQPAENALLARYTPLAWRGRIYGLKFVLTLGVATIGVALVPAIHGWTGSLDALILAIGGFAVVAAGAAILLPHDKDSVLAGRARAGSRATAGGD